ncbi:MAG: GNAT family N-acetyltransferase [Tissierellales bacterium]|nr:GNAT family N-acetyltransferase [Tissierellales bacterium]
MEEIRTDRLLIRRFKLTDLSDFYYYAKNPNVGPNAGWDYHRSKEESLDILKNFVISDEVWAIEYFSEKKVIGSIGLHKDRKRDNKDAKMLGYVLSEDYWGKGIATEAAKSIIKYAFEELNIDILSVYHYPFNERSRNVILKCGFNFEGILRRATVTYDGKIYDDWCYSLTREEYFKLGDKSE